MNLEQGERLIKLARGSIESVFSHTEIEVDDGIKKEFSKEQGVFVTLTIDGDLRGCIGFPEPVYPLWKAVVEAGRSAAFGDPRFPELSKEEYEKVSVEISVLSVPELIKADRWEDYPKKIKIGEDGLIIRGSGSGLLLPQVFTEHKCDAVKALEMTCEKAMMRSDAWKDLSNKVYKFQAEIFSEEDGKVVTKN